MWRGCPGSCSSLRRSMATCVSTVRLITSSAYPQTSRNSSSRPAAPLEQRDQQLVFLGPELGGPPRPAHLVPGKIDRDVPKAPQGGLGGSFPPGPFEKISGAPDGGDHALVVERLQQVIKRLNLESTDCLFLEGCDEHDGRPAP